MAYRGLVAAERHSLARAPERCRLTLRAIIAALSQCTILCMLWNNPPRALLAACRLVRC